MTQANTFKSDNTYSRLVKFEIENFMSIKHAVIEFDERNIIQFVGYNDAGKSAIMRGFDVAFNNSRPSEHLSYIHDGAEYFRLISYFSDGVCILRDKYINGQSLIEMYKDNECIFTTKVNGVLTPVKAIPEAVKTYLGLAITDDWYINSRSCFEKQLLVQTKGSENARSLNTVLRADELTQAGILINNDKNRLNQEIQKVQTELSYHKEQIRGTEGLNSEFIEAIKRMDENIDLRENALSSLVDCKEMMKNVASIPDIPTLEELNIGKLSDLASISDKITQIKGIPDYPELNAIDSSKLIALAEVKYLLNEYNSINEAPQLSDIDFEKLTMLSEIKFCIEAYNCCLSDIASIDTAITETGNELAEKSKELEQLGAKYVVCQNCGAYVPMDSGHAH